MAEVAIAGVGHMVIDIDPECCFGRCVQSFVSQAGLVFALHPIVASAQTGIVPCTGVKNDGGEIRCTVCHLYVGVREIIAFI